MLILAICLSTAMTVKSVELSPAATEIHSQASRDAQTEPKERVSPTHGVEVVPSVTEKVVPKRSLENFVGDGAWAGGFGGVSWTPSTVKIASLPSNWNSWNSA